MDKSKPQKRLSIITVIIIFLVVYLGELGLGAGSFFYMILPKMQGLQQQKITQQFEDKKKSSPQMAEIISLYQQLSPEVTKQAPEITKILESKNYDGSIKAVNDLQPKTKNDADRVFSNLILVQAYIGKKDQENTKKSAEALIKYGSKFSLGYRYMSQVDLDEKNYKDALDQARKAVEIDPNQAYNHYLLSIALYWNYQDAEALKEIKKAVQLDPSNTEYKKELDSQQKSAITPQQQSNTKTTTPTTPAVTTLNYSQQDIDGWKTEIDRINMDLQTTQKFLNNPSYDQTKMQRLNTLLNQMKTIADKIYGKMSQKQVITAQDEKDITSYDNYYTEEQALVKEIFH